MDRQRELENLRRSLAILKPGATASLSREEAIRLITEGPLGRDTEASSVTRGCG